MYIPMTIGGKKYSETSLWTNPSPTSSFTNQTITLSESIENYTYIKVRYRFQDSDARETSIFCLVSDFKTYTGTGQFSLGCVMTGSSNYPSFNRPLRYGSSTTVSADHCYRGSASAGSTYDTCCIPLEILGLNELNTGKRFNETSLWTNSSPTSNFNAQTVNLSDSLSNYDYIKVKVRFNTSTATENEVMCSVSQFKTMNIADGGFWLSNTLVSTYSYTRMYRYVSDTEIYINTAFKYGTSSGTTAPSFVIPIEIKGCKFA